MRIVKTIRPEKPGDVWVKQRIDAPAEELLALDVADVVAVALADKGRDDAMYIEVNLEVAVVRQIVRGNAPSPDAPEPGEPQT